MAENELTTQAQPNMEMLRYKEELAEKMGLPSPFGMQLLKQTCQDMVDSGMVPAHFKGNPMAVYGAAMRGREMGLNPIESVMETFWAAPGGRLGMYASKMLDLLHRGGVKSKFLKEDVDGCEILFTPPNGHEPYTAKFYTAEAQAAGLLKPDSNWQKWRSDMNRARAISRGWRALLGTFKGGTANLYSKEEMEDSGMLDEVSSTGEPSDADRKRAEVLAAKAANPMGDFVVKPKTQAPREESPIIDAEPEPEPEPVPTGEKAAQPDDIVYEIHTLLKLASGGARPIPCGAEPPHTSKETAALRAQALANTNGEDHMLIRVNRTTGERSEDLVLKAPAKPKAEPQPEAKPEAKPEPKPLKSNAVKRLEALRQKLPVEMTAKTFATKANGFVAAYVGVAIQDLGKTNAAVINDAIDALAEQIDKDPAGFEKFPAPSGQERKARYTAMAEYLKTQWPDDELLQTLGLKLARLRGFTAEEFKLWFGDRNIALNTVPIQPISKDGRTEPMSQAEAYLRLALRVPRLASYLLKACREHKLSIAFALDQIETRALGGPVATADQEQIEKATQAYLDAIAQEAEKEQKAAAEAAAPAPASDDSASDDESAGLFSEFSAE